METGEILGILFLVIVFGFFAYRGYRAFQCPGCGGFRTMNTISVERTVIDDEYDMGDVIMDILDRNHKPRSTYVEWVDRCNKCGYEQIGKGTYSHH